MDYVTGLVTAVDRASTRLLAMSPEDSARHPAPGKWSIKEIIGHLVDSAANNHLRFVNAQWQDDLVIQGYKQDAWVSSQRHQDAPWPELVVLWRAYNLHLARVMNAISEQDRMRPRHPHNLRLMGGPLPADQPVKLDDLMRDYVEHLEHHLRQIDAISQAGSQTRS